jgi:two-component system chemotaxis response regulator CheB
MMDDGAAGLRAVRARGGLALVQDPGDAAFPSMPAAAIAEADPQLVAPIAALAERLCAWVTELPERTPEAAVEPADPDPAGGTALTAMTCPECGGTLWLQDDYGAHRFRCRVGHAFSFNGLLLGKHTVLERALYAAVVALEERADLSRRILKRLEQGNSKAPLLQRYRDDAESAEQRAGFLRDLISELVEEASQAYGGTESDDTTA